MGDQYLTTVQAGKLLGVSSDTVLRWIRGGFIAASRTLGGHYRIELRQLQKLLEQKGRTNTSDQIKENGKFLPYCWEFNKEKGLDTTKCENCLAYRSRAQYCFELKHLPRSAGHLRVCCASSCEACSYYRFVSEQITTS